MDKKREKNKHLYVQYYRLKWDKSHREIQTYETKDDKQDGLTTGIPGWKGFPEITPHKHGITAHFSAVQTPALRPRSMTFPPLYDFTKIIKRHGRRVIAGIQGFCYRHILLSSPIFWLEQTASPNGAFK